MNKIKLKKRNNQENKYNTLGSTLKKNGKVILNAIRHTKIYYQILTLRKSYTGTHLHKLMALSFSSGMIMATTFPQILSKRLHLLLIRFGIYYMYLLYHLYMYCMFHQYSLKTNFRLR